MLNKSVWIDCDNHRSGYSIWKICALLYTDRNQESPLRLTEKLPREHISNELTVLVGQCIHRSNGAARNKQKQLTERDDKLDS